MARPATPAGNARAPTPQSAQSSRPNVLSLNISSKSALYVAYVSQLKNGGIFIPTNRDYAVGEEVFMLLSLVEDPTKFPVAGKVAWITPPGAQNNRPQGIGIHFNADDNSKALRRKIEMILTGALGSTRPTNTL
ncbi:MAG: PilZ domain-containing protein [Zoogloeaceae bacterium]|jgi:type IV pilus assembly protein PilZ|nr:PilZ domain-containing protein [Zoogloeaceae bacterium]